MVSSICGKLLYGAPAREDDIADVTLARQKTGIHMVRSVERSRRGGGQIRPMSLLRYFHILPQICTALPYLHGACSLKHMRSTDLR